MDELKKKRGRKPKNFTFGEPPVVTEKKKRGRKKSKIEPVIAAADFETDPFSGEGNFIKPFATFEVFTCMW
jgi:hypothetical protein